MSAGTYLYWLGLSCPNHTLVLQQTALLGDKLAR
jgi:hypothetical protein